MRPHRQGIGRARAIGPCQPHGAEEPFIRLQQGLQQGELGIIGFGHRIAEREACTIDVQSGIARNPPKYREAFVLREINQCTYEEIAEITGLKLGTVRSRSNRGRSHFRDIMEPLLKKALGEG